MFGTGATQRAAEHQEHARPAEVNFKNDHMDTMQAKQCTKLSQVFQSVSSPQQIGLKCLRSSLRASDQEGRSALQAITSESGEYCRAGKFLAGSLTANSSYNLYCINKTVSIYISSISCEFEVLAWFDVRPEFSTWDKKGHDTNDLNDDALMQCVGATSDSRMCCGHC